MLLWAPSHGLHIVRARNHGKHVGEDPSGGQHNKNFPRKTDAERHLTTIESRRLTGDYVDPNLAKIKFGDWSTQVEAGRLDTRKSTKARDESCLRSLILPALGQLSIGSIQPTTIQQWLTDLHGRGYAPATTRKAYQILARTFNAAVESGLLARSPCRGVRLPRLEHTEKRFLTPDEIADLASAIVPRFKALVLTAAYTGARFGELAALDLDHYQPLRRTIRIERTLSEVRGRILMGEPKTRAAARTVTLPSWLIEVIAEHLTTHPPPDTECCSQLPPVATSTAAPSGPATGSQ